MSKRRPVFKDLDPHIEEVLDSVADDIHRILTKAWKSGQSDAALILNERTCEVMTVDRKTILETMKAEGLEDSDSYLVLQEPAGPLAAWVLILDESGVMHVTTFRIYYTSGTIGTA